jgi:hypothetical protein
MLRASGPLLWSLPPSLFCLPSSAAATFAVLVSAAASWRSIEIAAVLLAEWRAESGRAESWRVRWWPTPEIGTTLVTIDHGQARIARPEVLPVALPALVAVLDAGSGRRPLAATAEPLDISARTSGPASSRRVEVVETLDLSLSDRNRPDESRAAHAGRDENCDDPRMPHGSTLPIGSSEAPL